MLSEQDHQTERERLYESESLRDDLDDNEATRLLAWGETQVLKLAAQHTDLDPFEQQCRFLRQLLKAINRFVGQRQFADDVAQDEYLAKIMLWLPKVGFEHITLDQLKSVLAPTPDMSADLTGILTLLTPDESSQVPTQPITSTPTDPFLSDTRSNITGESIHHEQQEIIVQQGLQEQQEQQIEEQQFKSSQDDQQKLI